MESLVEYAKVYGAELVNIGDSKRARRIMEGTREARDIVRVVERVSKEKGVEQNVKDY